MLNVFIIFRITTVEHEYRYDANGNRRVRAAPPPPPQKSYANRVRLVGGKLVKVPWENEGRLPVAGMSSDRLSATHLTHLERELRSGPNARNYGRSSNGSRY